MEHVTVAAISRLKVAEAHEPTIDGGCESCLACGTGKPRGYAFIEYEHKNNMKEAYKRADGKKVEGKRVVVDVERGRTVPNWYISDLCASVSLLGCGQLVS